MAYILGILWNVESKVRDTLHKAAKLACKKNKLAVREMPFSCQKVNSF